MEKKNISVKNPNWTLLLEQDQLIVSGGQDEFFLIDELNSKEAKELFELYKKSSFENIENKNIHEVVQKLKKLGIIYPKHETKNKIKYSIRTIGKEDKKVSGLIKKIAQNEFEYESEEKADIIIMVRRGGKPSDILKDYPIDKPHILIDVGNNHTISLGPIVFPSETACLGCFVGRLTFNWGDADSPKEPLASTHIELLASLIIEQLRTFQNQGNCPALLEKSISVDLNNYKTMLDHIYKLPWCPYCFPDKESYGEGSFELPWINQR